jgi:thiamine kinase-like enzyme
MRARGGSVDDRVEAILALVPQLSGGTITPLSGGITNRSYRVDSWQGSFVLRLGGTGTDCLGIDRSNEYVCTLAAAQAGVGADVLTYLPEQGALVTKFVEGRLLSPDDGCHPEILRRVVESLRRYHESPDGAGAFSPFATVRNYLGLCVERGIILPPSLPDALATLGRIEEELRTNEPACPCHNDLLPANFIDNGEAVKIVDWEYAGMGDRFFDLGNFAVNHQLDEDGERLFLESYFGEVRPQQVTRLRLMRLASDMREAMWGFLQFGISTLDFDFLAYGREHLERFLAARTALETNPAKLL